MYPRIKKFILSFVFVCVFAPPTTAPTSDWIYRWHFWLRQTAAPQQATQELHKWYQLREFCNQSEVMEKRIDFAIQKLRDKRDYWDDKTAQWGSSTTNPKHVTINFGPSENPTLYDPYFINPEFHTNPLADLRNRQVQILRDRNSRYLQKILNDGTKSGAEDPSIRGLMQAKYGELTQIIKTGDFRACITELDGLLPTQVKKGGRQ